MSLRRQLGYGLRALVDRRAADQNVTDELQDYIDRTVAARVAEGLSPDDARRAARREGGNPTIVREQVRAYGWENTVEAVLGDVRYAVRRLHAAPGFTIVSVLTLALGIGASTAIFSAVNPILFEPLPYPNADRIVMLSDRDERGAKLEVTFGTYVELLARTQAFAALAVLEQWQPALTGATEPERLQGQRVSASYFHTLGVAPRLGRDFDASDDRPRGANLAIVSDALWRRRLDANPAIVGRQVTLNGDPYTVIGVMPADFDDALGAATEVWSLLQYDPSLASLRDLQAREWGHHLTMVGRLAPGVPAERATREIDRIARSPIPEFARPSWAVLGQGLSMDRLQDSVTSTVRPVLLAMLGAVLLVLAIACVNVTNLLLTRGTQRRGELAMRAALGAGRGRIIRQLLTESLLLALIGGALGLVVAALGTQALVALSPPDLPRVGAIRVSGAVFIFAFALTTMCGLLVGLIPALNGTRGGLATRRIVGGRQSTRRALVVVEVALALVLLVSAGLLFRSLERVLAVPLGFDASHLLTMEIQAVGRPYDDDRVRERFFSQALDAVRRVPGVTSAGFTSLLPLNGRIDGYGVRLESSASSAEFQGSALRYAVSPDYPAAMRIAIRRGRSLGEHDAAGQPLAALVSASFGTHNFPGVDPIGRRFRFGPDTAWATIVGIVDDVKQPSLAVSESDAVYVTTDQWAWVDRMLALVVRTRGDAAAITPTVKAAIWSVDKDQPIVRIATMDRLLARSEAQRRFALVVFEAFGLVALGLAAIGLYGVLSGSVTERLREIGVRSALGASPATSRGWVVREGMTLAGLGVVIGLGGALLASQAIVALLFDVSRFDPVTYVGVIGLLLGVAGVACWLPAWRAAGVAPLITLRAE